MIGGPLDLLLQDLWSHYTVLLPQITSNILDDAILRLGLNLCDAGPICLQLGRMIRNVSISSMIMLFERCI